MNIIQGKIFKLLRRTSINLVNKILGQNSDWKILDIGCGFTANKNATIIADTKDFSDFYKDKKFIKINEKNLPFKDNEFDYKSLVSWIPSSHFSIPIPHFLSQYLDCYKIDIYYWWIFFIVVVIFMVVIVMVMAMLYFYY